MLGLSQRKYAESRKARGLVGGSQAAVSKAVAAGRIHTLADGSIDPAAADLEWGANTSEAMQRRPAPSALSPAPAVLPAVPGMLPLVEDDKPTKADAERELTELKVERAKLALQRDRSEVIAVAEVEDTVGELITAAQSRLLLVPHKIADELARTTDPIACRNILEHAIREALEELSKYEVAA